MKCSACEHPRRVQIDARLLAGESIPRLAQFFDLDTRLLHVHKREHTTEFAPAIIDRPSSQLEDLEWIKDQCRVAIKELQGKDKINYQSLALMLGEMRRCCEASVSVARGLHLSVGGGMPADWSEVRDRLLQVLEPHPAALEAVLGALEEK